MLLGEDGIATNSTVWDHTAVERCGFVQAEACTVCGRGSGVELPVCRDARSVTSQ